MNEKLLVRGRNSRQWRALGYKTLFSGGLVMLHKAGEEFVYVRPVLSGRWMDCTDLLQWDRYKPEHLPAGMREHLQASLEFCYCDDGVGLCDVCAGRRLI